MSRGFIVVAQNNSYIDYLRAAYGLALSLKKTQSKHAGLTVMITPGMDVPEKYANVFDHVVDIPWGDMAVEHDWKIHNKWKVYYTSPYDETILMDADMLVGTDLDAWWNILGRRPVYACTAPYTFRGEPIRNTMFREAFVACDLPHIYTACFYFRKSLEAHSYFRIVESVYENWDNLRQLYPKLPIQVSGDAAFALAMRLANRTQEYTGDEFPGIVHMKTPLQQVGNRVLDDWTRHISAQVRSDGSIYVGGYRQILPFHYQEKSFLTDEMIERLEHV